MKQHNYPLGTGWGGRCASSWGGWGIFFKSALTAALDHGSNARSIGAFWIERHEFFIATLSVHT